MTRKQPVARKLGLAMPAEVAMVFAQPDELIEHAFRKAGIRRPAR